MNTLTQEQLVWLKHNANRIPATKIVDLILKYDNLSLEDFELNLANETNEKIKILLNQRLNQRIIKGEEEWYSLLCSINTMNSVYRIREAIGEFMNKYENIEELSSHVEYAKTIDKLFQYCILDESIYAFLAQEIKGSGILNISISELLSWLFKDQELLLFALACNLYAYVEKEDIAPLKCASKSFLSSIDGRHLFGRYAHSTSDINGALLPYTEYYIPELPLWINLLEYTHDIYPCMPDMKWWRSEGELYVAKSIFTSIQDFIRSFPDSVFWYNAERICEDSIPTLYRWLYEDMKNCPQKYSASVLRELVQGNGEVFKEGQKYNPSFSALEFFRYFQLDVHLDDLVLNGILTENEANSFLYERGYLSTYKSIRNNYADGVDVWFVGSPGSGKSSIVNSLLSFLRRDGSVVYDEAQIGEQFEYLHSISECIEYSLPPLPNGKQTCIQIQTTPSLSPINIMDGEIFPEQIKGVEIPLRPTELNQKIICFVIGGSEKTCCRLDDNYIRYSFNSIHYISEIIDVLEFENKYVNRTSTLPKITTIIVLFSIDNYELFDKLWEKSSALLHKLEYVCHKYSINIANNYKPYIMKYSSGINLVGGLFRYDFTDAEKLCALLNNLIPMKSNKPWYKRLFNGFKLKHWLETPGSDDPCG